MRKYAREISFCLVYEYFFKGERNDMSFDLFDASLLTEDDKTFIKSLYNGVIDNLEEYKEKITKYSKGYKIDRIFKVDLAILVSAMHEMSHFDTPPAVCVNEAVEIAKKFSTKKSLSYVNGLLAQFIRQEIETKA
ncbi:MAG TPA: transcription antitermination factor NusB [Clostridia bacterium]|nr:transcription antitermination factor NusB [Clostridia bacterium]